MNKCGVTRVADGAIEYLRTHILTYMRDYAKHVAATMLHKFDYMEDVSVNYKVKTSRASGKVSYVMGKDGMRMTKPDKFMEVDYDNKRLTMSMQLLEDYIIMVATNGRFITEFAGSTTRKTLTVKDMKVAHAIDKKNVMSLCDGLAEDAPKSWAMVRHKMVLAASKKYKEENGVASKKSKSAQDEDGDEEINGGPSKKSKKGEDEDSDEDDDEDDDDSD